MKKQIGEAEQKFITKRLTEEWETIERGVKREKIVERSKETAKNIARYILLLSIIGGALTVAAVAPNLFGVLGKMGKRRGFFEKKNFRHAANYLSERKYIDITRRNHNLFKVSLTDKGRDRISRLSFDDIKIRKTEKWDGTWRMVIFDIPNKLKSARDALRRKFIQLEFYQIQKSVFVSPYECDEELSFLVSMLSLGPYVRVIKTKYISGDQNIKAHFRIKT